MELALPDPRTGNDELSVIDIASSLTAALSWKPAASLGNYRNKTVGG
jgi:hypothetical protein